MKVTQSSPILTALLVACLAGSALAQAGSSAGRLYDPNTETTVKGTVEKVTEIGDEGWTSTHLTLRANGQTYDVRVGPTENGVTFSTREQIEVIGSRLKFGDVDTVVAREITRNGQTLTLRNAQGFPLWAGARMCGRGHGRGRCGGCGGCGVGVADVAVVVAVPSAPDAVVGSLDCSR